jgi:hypothetical protein
MIAIAVTAAAMTAAVMAAIVRSYQSKLVITSHTTCLQKNNICIKLIYRGPTVAFVFQSQRDNFSSLFCSPLNWRRNIQPDDTQHKDT